MIQGLKRLAVVALPMALSGCLLPIPYNYVSLALNTMSMAFSGKGLSEHALSTVVQKDCVLWRMLKAEPICVDYGVDEPVTVFTLLKQLEGDDEEETAENTDGAGSPDGQAGKGVIVAGEDPGVYRWALADGGIDPSLVAQRLVGDAGREGRRAGVGHEPGPAQGAKPLRVGDMDLDDQLWLLFLDDSSSPTRMKAESRERTPAQTEKDSEELKGQMAAAVDLVQ